MSNNTCKPRNAKTAQVPQTPERLIDGILSEQYHRNDNIPKGELQDVGTLNSEQARKLFQENSIMIAGKDVVPSYRVVELFGLECIDKNFYEMAGKDRGYWGMGCDYINQNGFNYIVTNHNANVVSKAAEQSVLWQMLLDMID